MELTSQCEAMSLGSLMESEVSTNPTLVERSKVNITLLNRDTLRGVHLLYSRAYASDPWFFWGDSASKDAFLDINLLRGRISHPNHVVIVFTGLENEVLGSTSLIRLEDSVSIDWTQLDPTKGKGKLIMENYYRRFVPLLEGNGENISTNFVLTRESGSLRRVLIGELGMVSTGILPHILRSDLTRQRESEVTAVKSDKYQNCPLLIPEAHILYNIVAEQIGYDKKEEISISETPLFDELQTEEVSTTSPHNVVRQHDLYVAGFRPLVYDPIGCKLTMGRIPNTIETNKLAFLYDELRKIRGGNIIGMESNIKLLNYLNHLIGGRNEIRR